MSIANLFVDNSYTIKCANLECRELTAGDVIIPSGIIDDLYTDRIRSGQTQNVVVNISTGEADFYGDVFPNTNETLDLGKDINRWDNLYCKNVDASGILTATGQASAASLLLSTPLFPGSVAQTALSGFFSAGGSLVPSGAANPAEGNYNFIGYRINNQVLLYITVKPTAPAIATGPIILTALPVGLRPSAGRVSYIDIDHNGTKFPNARITIDTDGVCTIYSNDTNGTFTNLQPFSLDYPDGCEVLISFKIA